MDGMCISSSCVYEGNFYSLLANLNNESHTTFESFLEDIKTFFNCIISWLCIIVNYSLMGW